MASSTNPTAGRGDPYWYEWYVGLKEVVEMLNPDSEIESVAFQVAGAKGWDDVVVKLRKGWRRHYQVKHTRADDTLTFGDLVQHEEGGESLLKSLFASWRDTSTGDQSAYILYTNREAGTRWSTTEQGERRPPLTSFYEWMRKSVESATSLSDIQPSHDLAQGWRAWLDELSPGNGDEQLAFMRALEIHDRQSELEELANNLQSRLAIAFGVSDERVSPVFDALHRALRKWTTGHERVTVEQLCSELALPAETNELAPAPPPPTPFFPTRIPIAEELETVLASNESNPVIFLTAEPGAGKTSVISWLANRRADKPFMGLIGARFFCFEPIRPESPIIAPDSSRVRPEDLWFSLLAQLREGLRGRLHELRVPLRNDFLKWSEAREHVLRLADIIGKERKQHFVIVIDGIDHAARASQTMPEQIAAFFASLPGPDELSSKSVRLLVAGQPPQFYREQYPAWLLSEHKLVLRIDLPGLQFEDVKALYLSSHTKISGDHADAAVRLIDEMAKGNTLATVFAVAEAETLQTLELLETRLRERRLGDGLATYYSSIWQHTIRVAGDSAAGIDAILAGTLSLARGGILASFLSSAFSEWEKPIAWWQSLLESLGPLLTENEDGFRVRHNDVRVFLSSRFASFTLPQRQRVSLQIARYLQRSSTDRFIAHIQLFDLFELAGIPEEAATSFDVDWIFEAAALGIDDDQLLHEGSLAVRALPLLRSWRHVVSVGCATHTLNRLLETREHSDFLSARSESDLPPFLPTEAAVRPTSQWTTSDLDALTADAGRLEAFGENDRASALLTRWLGGINVCQLVSLLSDSVDSMHHEGERLAQLAQFAFRRLGRVYALLKLEVSTGTPSSKLEQQALFHFEEGFIEGITENTDVASLTDLVGNYRPMYLANWELLLRNLASAERWNIVRECLKMLSRNMDRLPNTFLAEATWMAIRSGASADDVNWLAPLELARGGFETPESSGLSDPTEPEQIEFAGLLGIARSLGWTRLDLDAGDIAETVYEAYGSFTHYEDRRAPTILVFRSAALLGRISGAISQQGAETTRGLISPAQVSTILNALWGDTITRNFRFEHRKVAAELAEEIVSYCSELGVDYVAAAADAAMGFATSFPIDSRLKAIWTVVSGTGNPDLLIEWVTKWIGEDGEAWHLSRDELHEIVSTLSPLAEAIGQADLAHSARSRAAQSIVGYVNRKEYIFGDVYEWFSAASVLDPTIWRDAGWTIWCVCEACDRQSGDNRMRWQIREEISATALRCGATHWWQLVKSTLDDINDEYWHDSIRDCLVDGMRRALSAGARFNADDVRTLFGLGICFSYWTEKGDNAALVALRSALIDIAEPEKERQTLDEGLPKVVIRHQSRDDSDSNGGESDKRDSTGYSLEQTLREIADGREVSLAQAAHAIEAIIEIGGAEREKLVIKTLKAIGGNLGYASAWHYHESGISESLVRIVHAVSDDELWTILDTFSRDIGRDSRWTHAIASNLLDIAFARASSKGLDQLLEGLKVQLHMHLRWSFGTVEHIKKQLPKLPDAELGVTWKSIVHQLIPILLESHSAEVLAAALHGLHCLVALDQTLIPNFFATLNSTWIKYWMLSAAESWAALYPEAMKSVRQQLEDMAKEGRLEQRLQAWIVHCKHSDAVGIKRMPFPVPASAVGEEALKKSGPGIIYTPPMHFGHAQFIDRHAGAASKLRRLAHCGFNFSSLESSIAESLSEITSNDQNERRGPRRRQDIFCTTLDEEEAVGKAISSVLSTKWFEQTDAVLLAEGYLCNEDAWLQRSPPVANDPKIEWPFKSEYGGDSDDDRNIRSRLREILIEEGHIDGWRTFAGRIIVCTWKMDYLLHVWWEQLSHSMLISSVKVPTCPTGRTFIWWLGDFFEPPTDGDRFVTGFFVGGMQRLSNCNLEIQPSKIWRTALGWEPDVNDPLTWRRGGEVVARYERFHGPLRDNPQSPRSRQPIVERWVVSEAAFDQAERNIGPLRVRENYETHDFGEDLKRANE